MAFAAVVWKEFEEVSGGADNLHEFGDGLDNELFANGVGFAVQLDEHA